MESRHVRQLGTGPTSCACMCIMVGIFSHLLASNLESCCQRSLTRRSMMVECVVRSHDIIIIATGFQMLGVLSNPRTIAITFKSPPRWMLDIGQVDLCNPGALGHYGTQREFGHLRLCMNPMLVSKRSSQWMSRIFRKTRFCQQRRHTKSTCPVHPS